MPAHSPRYLSRRSSLPEQVLFPRWGPTRNSLPKCCNSNSKHSIDVSDCGCKDRVSPRMTNSQESLVDLQSSDDKFHRGFGKVDTTRNRSNTLPSLTQKISTLESNTGSSQPRQQRRERRFSIPLNGYEITDMSKPCEEDSKMPQSARAEMQSCPAGSPPAGKRSPSGRRASVIDLGLSMKPVPGHQRQRRHSVDMYTAPRVTAADATTRDTWRTTLTQLMNNFPNQKEAWRETIKEKPVIATECVRDPLPQGSDTFHSILNSLQTGKRVSVEASPRCEQPGILIKTSPSDSTPPGSRRVRWRDEAE